MKFKDKHRFVRSNMKKNRTRVWMTILASTIGCAFLIMLASVGFAIHKTAVDDVMSYRMMNEIQIQRENGILQDNDVKKLEQVKGVQTVTRKKNVPGANEFSMGEYHITTSVYSAHMPSEIKAGFELDRGRMPESKNEIVVGYHFAEQFMKKAPDDFYKGLNEEEASEKNKELAYDGDLLGKTVSYHFVPSSDVKDKAEKRNIDVKIVGIGKKPTKEWAMATDAYITQDLQKEVMDVLTSQNLIETNPEVTGDGYEVKVYTASAEDVKEVSERIEKLGFLTYSVVSELKEMNIYFTLFKAGLIFIGAIAVLIASIGIFNTMTMAVTERSQDIGIMKAIGATPKTIKRIFLLESGYIGLWGVGLGTVLAYAISYGVNFALPIIIEHFINEKPPEDFILSYIPWSLTVIAITICMGVTLLSGWRPAAKATTVDVLKALRRDV